MPRSQHSPRRKASSLVRLQPGAAPQEVIAARRRFLTEGVAPAQDVSLSILRSWQRCATYGLDMAVTPHFNVLSQQTLRETQERNELLVRAARGEVETLFRDAAMSGGIVILTDGDGVLLFAAGAGDFAKRAAGVMLRPGACWDEKSVGTNAIGTALTDQQSTVVTGGEHFFEMHNILSCSAVPILDPCGAVIGILDLTNSSDVPQTHTLALVQRAVEQIERNLFDYRFGKHEQIHFHSDPYLVGSTHEGLLAFDGECLVGANRQGISLLNLDWSAVGTHRFGELFTIDQGSMSHNPASDDCLIQTKAGQTLFARMRPSQGIHSVWPATGTGVLPGALPTMREEPQLRDVVDRILSSPCARQLTIKQVKAGQIIYGADVDETVTQGLLLVRKGRLRCFASCDGKELTLFTLDANDAIPLHAGSMFEVKKAGEIVIISMAVFQRLAQSDPDLALSAMPALDRMLQKSLQMTADMVFRDVKFRLIRALCETVARDGRETPDGIVLDTPPNAEDFAMQIGTSRQSVSTAIAELIRSGIIRREGATAMVVADLGRLRDELD